MSTVPRTTGGDAIASVPNEHSTATSPSGGSMINFSAMAVFSLGTVFLGFARTYFLAGIWPTTFPTAHRSAWRRLYGVDHASCRSDGAGGGSANSSASYAGTFRGRAGRPMVVLRLAAATDSLARGFAPPRFPYGPQVFYAIPVFAMITFMTLIGARLWMRSNGPAHKRLVLLATVTLLAAAFGRSPFAS